VTLVDAGPLIALLDQAEADHRRCADILGNLVPPLVTTWAVFTEASYLLGARGGWPMQEALWKLVLRGDLWLAPVEGDVLHRSHELMEKYRDQPMDLADATLVALAESQEQVRVFTLDSDFRVYRLHGRKPLDLIP